MGRRFRKTEINEVVNTDKRLKGQYMHCNMFCINCHGLNKHYPECRKKESYAIPATAEIPAKQSSKRKWSIFKNQFVFARPVGYWQQITSSWWYINVYLKNAKNFH